MHTNKSRYPIKRVMNMTNSDRPRMWRRSILIPPAILFQLHRGETLAREMRLESQYMLYFISFSLYVGSINRCKYFFASCEPVVFNSGCGSGRKEFWTGSKIGLYTRLSLCFRSALGNLVIKYTSRAITIVLICRDQVDWNQLYRYFFIDFLLFELTRENVLVFLFLLPPSSV